MWGGSAAFLIPMTTRLHLISEIALSEDGTARPLHILRTGSFTDSAGQDVTFSLADMAGIAARFGSRKLPITERHDWGRAVGRMTRVWSDGDSLYAQPTWNKYGRDLLAEQVYDGFSVEVDRQDDGWILIGGSLTNYPAVGGLTPVSLSAPVVDRLAAPGGADTQEIPMADETVVEAPPAPSPPVDAAALAQQIAAFNLPKEMAGQIAGMVRESVMAQFATVQAQAEAQTRAEIARFQREQQICTLSQHMTTPTMQRQHALPFEASRLSAFLNGLSETQRTEAIALFDHVLTAGLISFEEIGNAREGEDRDAPDAVFAEVERVKTAKIDGGMTTSAALSAAIAVVGKERYNAARTAQKKGGR